MDDLLKYGQMTINDFLQVLGGSDPVPGGGGASALSAAVGASLARMTCSLTIGKKKYADVEEEIKEISGKLEKITARLTELIMLDAEGFKPLADAFRLPSGTDEEKAYKEQVLETEYVNACRVPFEIMELCAKAVDLAIIVAEKGSRMVISDVASGIVTLEAAMRSASLNIYINAGSMKDREKAEALAAKADEITSMYSVTAGEAYNNILSTLRK